LLTYEGLEILRYPNDTPIKIYDDGVCFSGKICKLLAHFPTPLYIDIFPLKEPDLSLSQHANNLFGSESLSCHPDFLPLSRLENTKLKTRIRYKEGRSTRFHGFFENLLSQLNLFIQNGSIAKTDK
jgi:hypothetical protein